MAADYTYWRTALTGQRIPIVETEPQPGFYRRKVFKGRDTPWAPVAIWQDESGIFHGMQTFYVVNRPLMLSGEEVNELWMLVAHHPVSEEDYRAVAEEGKGWSDGTIRAPRNHE